MLRITLLGSTTSDSATASANGVFGVKVRVEGDYLLIASAAGYTSGRRTVHVPVDGLIVDLYLTREAVTLSTVRVVASSRRRPSLQSGATLDASTSSRGASSDDRLNGASTFDPGAIALTVPGVNTVPGSAGSFSVLGLPGDQNSIAFNGLELNGVVLPRDLGAFASVSMSPLDASRGGFSGAQLNIQLPAASSVSSRSVRASSSLARDNRTGAPPGLASQQRTDGQISASAAGPIGQHHAAYELELQGGRSTAPAPSLESLSASQLVYYGISLQNTAVLLQQLVPTRLPAIDASNSGSSELFSAFGRVEANPGEDTRISALVAASRTVNDRGALSATSLNSTASTLRSDGISAQLSLSQYFADGAVLNELRSAVSASTNHNASASSLPSARVAIQSLIDGELWTIDVGAGSDPLGATSSSASSVQVLNTTTWYDRGGRHRMSVNAGATKEWQQNETALAPNGLIYFSSLESLAAGAPSSYVQGRITTGPRASAQNAFLGLNDYWVVTPRFRLQAALRVDAGNFTLPATGDSVVRAAGLGGAAHPSWWSVSPRIGGSWRIGRRTRLESSTGDPFGVLHWTLVSVASNAHARPLAQIGLQQALGTDELSCIGVDVPAANWNAVLQGTAALPTRCAATAVERDRGLHRATYFTAYRPARSTRAAIGWTAYLPSATTLDAELIASQTTGLRSTRDDNLRANPAFTLRGEDGRPVFAPASSVDAVSGLIPANASRVNATLDAVSQIRSDLTSNAGSLVVSLTPPASVRASYTVSYVTTYARTQTVGFDATTAGDPRMVELTSSDLAPRHQIIGRGSFRLGLVANFNVFGSVQSGRPFTPLVGGDINGDGRSNDRAFIFAATDPALGTQGDAMKRLLATSPARECMAREIGRIAPPNSCAGPWTSTLNTNVTFDGPAVRLPERVSGSLSLTNVPAALDAIIHRGHVRGWGDETLVDQQLLRVSGFDPQRSAFTYTVNPTFGQATRASSSRGFNIALDFRIALGPDRDQQILEQELDRLASLPGETDTLKLRSSLGRFIPNIALALIRSADTLELSAAQVTALRNASTAYVAETNAIWRPFVQYLFAQRLDYVNDETTKRYKATKTAAYRNAADLGQVARGILTTQQYNQLPAYLRRYLDRDEVMAEQRNR